MKKALFLTVSLLSIISVALFAGCNRNNGGESDMVKDGQTRLITLEEETPETPDKAPEDTCPDCGKHGMPKVHFEFKNGRPATKHGEDNGEDGAPRHDKHHRHGKHKIAPPENDNENN